MLLLAISAQFKSRTVSLFVKLQNIYLIFSWWHSTLKDKGCQSCWQKCCLFMMILHMSENECRKDLLTCVEEKK